MPGQQGGRGDDSVVMQRAGEQPDQSGQDRSVWPAQARPGHLAAQDRDLVAQDEDLDVLGAVLLVSSPNQPNSVIVIRYSSRNSTVRDHAMITWCPRSRRPPPHAANFGTAQVSPLGRRCRRRCMRGGRSRCTRALAPDPGVHWWQVQGAHPPAGDRRRHDAGSIW